MSLRNVYKPGETIDSSHGGGVLVVGSDGTAARAVALDTGGRSLAGAGTPRNATQTSGANATNVLTIAAVTGQAVHLYAVDYFTSAGTATLTIQDGATTIWSGQTLAAKSLTGLNLVGTVGQAMTITIGAAGVSNTSTANISASQY